MPKENELTNQRELTEQELEFVAGELPMSWDGSSGPGVCTRRIPDARLLFCRIATLTQGIDQVRNSRRSR